MGELECFIFLEKKSWKASKNEEKWKKKTASLLANCF